MSNINNNYKYYMMVKHAILSLTIEYDDHGIIGNIDENLNGAFVDDEYVQFAIGTMVGDIEFKKENYKFISFPEWL